jgi:formyltetrahydrofolate deformylase
MIIIIQCPDQVGLVAAITAVLAKHQLNIISLGEHVDKDENRFYIRLNVEQPADASLLEQELKEILPNGSLITINPLPQKKIAILVTKEYHCLADILIRNYFGTLGAEVQCVKVTTPTCRIFASASAFRFTW